jgi:hypothetical protein
MMRGIHRRRSAANFVLMGIAMCKQFVRKQIARRHTNVFEVETEILRSLFGKHGLRRLGQLTRASRSRDECNDAISCSQVLVYLPAYAAMAEGAQKRMALERGFAGLHRATH